MDENAIIAEPGKKPRWRWYQFSLTLALLVMFLLCVLASWIGLVRYKERIDPPVNQFPVKPYEFVR